MTSAPVWLDAPERLCCFGLRLGDRSSRHSDARLSRKDGNSRQVAGDGQRGALTSSVRYGEAGNELDTPGVVFGRHGYRLQKHMSICQDARRRKWTRVIRPLMSR